MVRFGSTRKLIEIKCPKCGYPAKVYDTWTIFQCFKCGHNMYREGSGRFASEYIPSWKHNALEALHRERKDKFTPPNSVRKIIKDIEDGMAEVNEMIIEFDDSGSKRALMNAIYMFAGLEKTYYDNEPYIEIFAYERYIRIKSGIIVTRNQLNDRMDKVS